MERTTIIIVNIRDEIISDDISCGKRKELYKKGNPLIFEEISITNPKEFYYHCHDKESFIKVLKGDGELTIENGMVKKPGATNSEFQKN